MKKRTQEERSAETREKVIRAAAQCITEQGYKAATMAAIAKRAGVTWGAIQHQFGSKDAIFEAIIDFGADELNRQLQDLDLGGLDLNDRINAFLHGAWSGLKSPIYLAFIAIQRNRRHVLTKAQGSRMRKLMDDTWNWVFGDISVPQERMAEIKAYTFMTLNGMALEATIFTGGEEIQSHMKLLQETLLHLLTESPATQRAAGKQVLDTMK